MIPTSFCFSGYFLINQDLSEDAKGDNNGTRTCTKSEVQYVSTVHRMKGKSYFNERTGKHSHQKRIINEQDLYDVRRLTYKNSSCEDF